MAANNTWSPLAKVADSIPGKKDHDGKLYCACGNEPREFTVRKDGPTKGKVFYKCATDQCKLFVWQDHIQYYDSNGRRTSPAIVPVTSVDASPSTSAAAATASQGRVQSGVKGRSTPTSSPIKRKITSMPSSAEGNHLNFDQDDDDVFGSPTPLGSPSKRSKATPRSNRPVIIDEDEEAEADLIADGPPSPTLTPQKKTPSFGTTLKTPQSRLSAGASDATTHAVSTTPLSGALNTLRLDIQANLDSFEKECQRQSRLVNAATQKAEAKDRLLANAHKEIAQLKSRIRILEDENAALRSSQ